MTATSATPRAGQGKILLPVGDNGPESALAAPAQSRRAAPLYYRLVDRRREVNQLAKTLGLTPSEGQILLLLSQWEGISPTEFCRITLQAYFEVLAAGHGQLGGDARGGRTAGENARRQTAGDKPQGRVAVLIR